ncbi:MAG: hypothetical protein H0T42_25045 [Deltaproteobacteria bacterium]|nr:hypothetical protein [Deltaproteobacteria bacterium]
MPQAIAPQVETSPVPPNGYGRLVVDVVEGPTPVQQIRMESQPVVNGRGRTSYKFTEQPVVLCSVSPCAVDVPAGNVLLGFPVIGKDGMEVELVNVGPDPSVYRRSLSIYEDRTGGTRVLGIITTALGGASMMTGAALLPIGLSRDNGGLTMAGGITLGAGTVALVLGILAIRADAPTFRLGSSNHFPLSAGAP